MSARGLIFASRSVWEIGWRSTGAHYSTSRRPIRRPNGFFSLSRFPLRDVRVVPARVCFYAFCRQTFVAATENVETNQKYIHVRYYISRRLTFAASAKSARRNGFQKAPSETAHLLTTKLTVFEKSVIFSVIGRVKIKTLKRHVHRNQPMRVRFVLSDTIGDGLVEFVRPSTPWI